MLSSPSSSLLLPSTYSTSIGAPLPPSPVKKKTRGTQKAPVCSFAARDLFPSAESSLPALTAGLSISEKEDEGINTLCSERFTANGGINTLPSIEELSENEKDLKNLDPLLNAPKKGKCCQCGAEKPASARRLFYESEQTPSQKKRRVNSVVEVTPTSNRTIGPKKLF